MKRDKIIDSIQFTLSQPPCSAGRRLKSERELARIFMVGESKIRSSLEQLVREGILFRRRGSGTFVRRVAIAPESAPKTAIKSSEDLFSPLDENGNNDIEAPKIKLHFGLLTDYSINSPIQQALIASMSRAVSIHGHRLTVHSVIADYETNKRKSAPALREEIAEDACDGYIVPNDIGDLFNEVIQNKKVPVVYYLTGITPIDYEPVVFFNTIESIERAVHKFYAAGYKKIALMGIEHTEKKYEIAAYQRAMQSHGLEYRKTVFSQEGLVQSLTCAKNLLHADNPPQAVYVSDDNILAGLSEYLALKDLTPGRDLGIITLSNRGQNLPPSRNWSRMEFDREKLAQIIIENLLSLLSTANSRASTLALHANWIHGETIK
jgi:DNA-binding LacI/PurR family transcriptional regulator